MIELKVRGAVVTNHGAIFELVFVQESGFIFETRTVESPDFIEMSDSEIMSANFIDEVQLIGEIVRLPSEF